MTCASLGGNNQTKTNNHMTSEEKKAALKAVQDEVQEEVAAKRVALLEPIAELEALKTDEDYSFTIKKILQNTGDRIPLATLAQILPDASRLLEARKALAGEIGETKDIKDKTKLILTRM